MEIDSGIDTYHIEFAPVNGVPRTVANIFNQFGPVTANTDGNGHGTHCAGIFLNRCVCFLSYDD